MTIHDTPLPLPSIRLLIANKNPRDRTTYIRWIQHAAPVRVDIQEMESGRQALEACTPLPPHCILLDEQLSDMTGVEFLAKIRTSHSLSDFPAIFLIGRGHDEITAHVRQLGAQDYFIKNTLSEEILWDHIQQAVNQTTTFRHIQALEHQSSIILQFSEDGMIVIDTDGLIRFTNPAAERLFQQTGKELLGSPFGYPMVPGQTREITIGNRKTKATPVEMRIVPIEWENKPAYLVI